MMQYKAIADTAGRYFISPTRFTHTQDELLCNIMISVFCDAYKQDGKTVTAGYPPRDAV